MLLLSWNAAFYRPRPILVRTLVADVERLIYDHVEQLLAFRAGSIATYDETQDSAGVERMFGSFMACLWPVGAAKALHILAPQFFPLWDTAIAKQLGLDLSRGSSIKSYLRMMCIAQEFARGYQRADPLKALDEWAYVTFTVPLRRPQPA